MGLGHLRSRQPVQQKSPRSVARPGRGVVAPDRALRARTSSAGYDIAHLLASPGIQRACHCGGTCSSCRAERANGQREEEIRRVPNGSGFQSKFTIGRPGDIYEQEADRIADRVMRMSESELRRKDGGGPDGPGARPATALVPGLATGIESARGQGSALSDSTRSFFEPRFGTDFSRVRVHANNRAAQLAASVNARAFTVGSDLYFGQSEYRPGSADGRRLIAHELTHTLQQRGGAGGRHSRGGVMQRLVHPRKSNCPANVNGAPADPIAALQRHDAEARRMAMGASNVLFVESLVRDDPTFGPSEVSTGYLRRFGSPEQLANGKFRTRFTGGTQFDTENAAITAGMQGLASRFDRLAGLLNRSIDYDCPGTANFTLSGCTPAHCGPNTGAVSCPTGLRAIKICRGFWDSMNDAQRAGAIVHEAGHILYQIRNHNSGTPLQRRNNPECYTSFLAEIEPFTVWDTRCPRT